MPEGVCSQQIYDYTTREYVDCPSPAEFGPDPYAEEIYDDSTPVWLCEHHWQDRKGDI